MEARRSSLGLDLVNLFMADVKDGVGVYLSVYLLVVQKWDPSTIGLIVSIPFFTGLIFQSPVGALIDRTKHKKFLIFFASLVIALSCLVVIYFPKFYPIALSQMAVGFFQTVFNPCVAGMSLGMVGHVAFSKRIGRNESFNHLGNMIGAVASGLLGWYVSYEGVFYFSVFQCLAIILAIWLIREEDIDHDLARSAKDQYSERPSILSLRALFKNKDILTFTVAMCLFHTANGAMLPLLGQKIGITDVKYSAFWLSICIIIAQTIMTFVAPFAATWAAAGRKNILLVSFLLVPARALLFATIDNKYLLLSLQVIDGISAGIFGVVSILMMADLSRGTGHFNFLQGTVYAAMGIGLTLSNALSGFVVSAYGHEVGFMFLAVLGTLSSFFFFRFVQESAPELQKIKTQILATQI